jgi:hypothetical protein
MRIPLLPYCCAYVCLFPTLISLYYPVTFLNFDMFKCVFISNAYYPYYPVTFLNFDMSMCAYSLIAVHMCAYFQHLFPYLPCYLFEF